MIVIHLEVRNLKKMREKAIEPLYPSCLKSRTTLSTMIELQNLKDQFGMPGNNVTALLSWLKNVLPEGANLPDNYPKMKNSIKELGMECITIHACPNHCICIGKSMLRELSVQNAKCLGISIM